MVIWVDAGDVVTRRLTRLRGLISRFGMYTPKSPGKLLTWTHPRTLEILQIEQPLESRQNCNAALVAFDLSSRLATDLLKDWQMYAHREDCIAPQGHSALNHRWDQSILSCLVAKRNLIPSAFLLAVEAVGVKIHQDVE